ncbi:MAG: acetyl-CoA carboxylase, biotin carboxyl carrier protein [Elusimicrobia bacterium RIFOXYA2_FULL_50_26]|nr:MAG: acetyl-CoA carboxylase, biotin carboxyl carrier protein [Elusimicrobia bacterium RIFOXYA2_FULL_50_26]OGS24576.1 MAG: acetyl-CoA carboxylase, biotin carboxyl carrier protein [Elusimicrobia bacterium RIFOXYB2_FULL_50_12]
MKETAGGKTVDVSIKDRVSALYELMTSEHLDELEIKEKDFYLYIKRKSKTAAPAVINVPVAQAAAPAAAPVSPAPAAGGPTVKSPIIGVFYQASSPTAPSFVKEGDVVSQGKTLCIVEAMKVMNEIKADYRMKIVKILVENGKPIVSGQDLFMVEKA